MKRLLILLFFAFLFGFSFSRVHAAAIVADHNAVAAFNPNDSLIPTAAAKKVMMRHASVGQNIYDGLVALRSSCSACVLTNWTFVGRGNPGWQGKVDEFVSFVYGNSNRYDIFSMKFCFVDSTASWTYYRDHMIELENAYPNKKFIWWTMPISTSGEWGGIYFDTFNNQVRSYVQNNNKILFDLAAIESHEPNGVLHTASGHEAMYDSYTSDGGHLNSTGAARAAKAWWWLMAQVASGGSTPTSTPTPTRTPTPTSTPTSTPTLTPTPTPSCGLPGDIDCSGKVTIIDLSTLLSKFGYSYTPPPIIKEDLDGSGQVNAFDLFRLLQNFGK